MAATHCFHRHLGRHSRDLDLGSPDRIDEYAERYDRRTRDRPPQPRRSIHRARRDCGPLPRWTVGCSGASRAIRDLGYEVKSVGGQGDHGIDLIATKDGEKTAVQCRRFAKTRPVSEPQLRDLYGSMHAIGANRAVMVTTGRYTSSARDWARAKPIDLWGPDQLGKAAASTFSVTSGPAPELAPSLGRCPWSDSPLVVRTNRATSEKFIGCSDYPACKYTRPLATRDSRAQRQPPRLG